MSFPFKQIIVLRKDLNMRKGKMIAQGAHASLESFMSARATDAARAWYEGPATKIAVSVESEEELLAIAEQARAAGLPHALIQDSGRTEFGGVPTYTAVAIGPASSEAIDAITGTLRLL